MTLYDLVVVLFIALLGYRGFRAGLVRELLAWVALVLGLGLAFRFDGAIGSWLARIHDFGPTTTRILAFVAILLVVEIALGCLAMLLSRMLAPIPVLGRLNRLGGLLLGALVALIPVWLVTVALLLLPHALLSFSTAVRNSETAHLMRSLTPRWDQSLRAYLDHFTAGRLSPRLQQLLRQLTAG